MNYFDLHCDTIAECWKQKKDLWDNDLHLCLKRGAAYHPWLQCFAAWIPDELRGEAAYRYFEAVYGELLRQEALHGDKLKICRDEEDFQEAARTGKCGAIFTVEGGAALGGRLERVAPQGVRRQSGHAHLERLLRDRGRRGSGPSQGADAVRPGGCAGAGTEPHRGGRVPCERTALLGGGRKGPKAVPGHAFQCPRAL